mmetsp:Transcript_14137/g.40424  ORF Transcript_14137/g.40424 Transcript_14137/m.40424 type:complete len:200 (+) Transcript_14137:2012-2611(+)
MWTSTGCIRSWATSIRERATRRATPCSCQPRFFKRTLDQSMTVRASGNSCLCCKLPQPPSGGRWRSSTAFSAITQKRRLQRSRPSRGRRSCREPKRAPAPCCASRQPDSWRSLRQLAFEPLGVLSSGVRTPMLAVGRLRTLGQRRLSTGDLLRRQLLGSRDVAAAGCYDRIPQLCWSSCGWERSKQQIWVQTPRGLQVQ